MSKKRILTLFAAFAAVLTFGACGGEKRPEGFPELYPCSVKVIQGGAPLPGATVSLVGEDPQLMRWACGGNADENGVVELSTYGFPGAPAGTFKVVVTKTERPGAPTNAEEAAKTSPEELEGLETFRLVDAIYGSHTTTPLTIEVKAGNNPEQTVDVGEAVREVVPAL